MEMYPRVLSDTIARLLSMAFKNWRLGDATEDWKNANMIPIYKKVLKKNKGNYRSIYLTSDPG